MIHSDVGCPIHDNFHSSWVPALLPVQLLLLALLVVRVEFLLDALVGTGENMIRKLGYMGSLIIF